MQIIAWNVDHRIGKRPICPHIIPPLVACFPQADIIVLTEYYERPERRKPDQRKRRGHEKRKNEDPGIPHAIICEALRNADFVNIHTTGYRAGHNGVLIATKVPSKKGTVPTIVAATRPDDAASNYLHVSMPDFPLELIGFRIEEDKEYTVPKKCGYWDWIEQNVRAINSKRVIAIGDFNVDPHDRETPRKTPSKASIVDHFNKCFPDSAWHKPDPSGNHYSYYGHHDNKNLSKHPSRIDHALVSTVFAKPSAEYVAKRALANKAADNNTQHVFCAGPGNAHPMSDHAVLVLNVAVAPVSSA